MNGLDQTQVAALQAALHRRETELRSQLAEEVEPSLDAGSLHILHLDDAGGGDDGSTRTMNDLAVAEAGHLASELRSVRHALGKFSIGSYGLCEACGEKINAARLAALPDAGLCIACQGGKEKIGMYR